MRGLATIERGVWLAVLLGWPALGQAQVTFTDATAEAGVDYPHVALPETVPCVDYKATCHSELITAGATVGDYNDDGCIDLFVTRFDATDLLFENNCDGTFTDVAALVGLTAVVQSNGALFADIDSDGDLDLYVVTQRTNGHLLYINDGAHLDAPGTRPSFSEEAQVRGAAVEPDETRERMGTSVAAGDFDRDGYLDLFTTEWNQLPTDVTCSGTHARLLHNRGATAPGHFDDVTDAARTLMTRGGATHFRIPLSFAPAFPDLDDDGWPDLAVASDARTSRLFWNDANGRFSAGTEAAMVGTDEFGMGSTFGDYDNDGDLDWYVTSIYDDRGVPRRDGNRLYRNEGNRLFTDQTDAAGVRDGQWGWGAAFFDYDNDGDLDLAHTNGFPTEVPFYDDPIRLWRNDGGVMTEVATPLGITDTGDGRAFLTFDYDNDGDLDALVTNHNARPILYRNDGGNAADWLRVRVRGVVSATEGRGAKVTVRVGDSLQLRHIGVSSHFLGESETIAHFGLGEGFAAGGGTVEVQVRFPSGRTAEMTGVAPNQVVEVSEPDEGPMMFAPCVAEMVDCNSNGTVDLCDIAADAALDVDEDGVMDACSTPPTPQACTRLSDNLPVPDAGIDAGSGNDAGLDAGANPDAGSGNPANGDGGSGCAAAATPGPARTNAFVFCAFVVGLLSFRRFGT